VVNESREAAKWIYQSLTADSALVALVGARIYREVAPESATFPLVLFWSTGGSDLLGNDAARIWTEATFTIEAVCDGASADKAEAIAARISALFDRASGATTTARILSCVRESPTDSIDQDGGTLYPRLGGSYRLQIQAL
jgi:hypothetical protein